MTGEVILYTAEDGQARIELQVVDGSVWLSLSQIADLFDRDKSVISRHIAAVFADSELSRKAVVADYATTAADGKIYQVDHYRLEMILAIGYRVRSPRGVQFRRWATTVLQDYLIKGFAMDDKKLKEPEGGWDYFDELLERVREIRASEKRFYQKVRDLFTTAVDYDKSAETALMFFKTIQNKMLWAVTNHTAAELIVERADPSKPNMGLNSWKGDKVRKSDIDTAKNYLAESEMRELNRLVSAFLDLAADRAERRQQTTMTEWTRFVDSYLKLTERPILDHAGSVSHNAMLKIIDQRYATFDTVRKNGERQLAEAEHEREIEEELRQIEAKTTRAKRGKKISDTSI